MLFHFSFIILMLFSFNSQAQMPAIASSNVGQNIEQDANDHIGQALKHNSQSSSPLYSSYSVGRDYFELARPVNLGNPNYISVVHFFTYGCQSCSGINKQIEQWSTQMPYFVRLSNSPLITYKEWVYPARIYFALQKMKLEHLHTQLLDATSSGLQYQNYKTLKSWLVSRNVDVALFEQAFDSNEVLSQITAGPAIAQTYQISQIPVVIIDGKYAVQLNNLTSMNDLPKILTFLVQKAAKERQITQ